MGATIGQDVLLQTTDLSGFDLISIGSGSCLEHTSSVGAITCTAAPPPPTAPAGSSGGAATPLGSAPFGTMSLKALRIGRDVTVGPQCQVTSCTVPDGSLVEPCTASSNPARKGGFSGPKDADAVRTGHSPLGAAPALLSAAAFSFMFSVCMCVPAVGEWRGDGGGSKQAGEMTLQVGIATEGAAMYQRQRRFGDQGASLWWDSTIVSSHS
jgi:hypothetical protein